jgi:hypothetical protein
MQKIESLEHLLFNIEKGYTEYFTLFDNKRSTKSIVFTDGTHKQLSMLHKSSGRVETIDLVDWEQSSLLAYIDVNLYKE